ncbi:MAG: peptidylprolyl isomerase, partial [Nitrosomonas sp.]|nr:peptidylprolyl isomerase [Nitrosomonas sp.]
AEIQKRAELALARLQEGVEFAQVAAEFSDAEDAMTGGVLDWRPVMQMGPKFTEILTAMSIGELTPIVQSPIGYHILKLLDRREKQNAVVIIDQTNARHILAKVNELTSESDAHQRIAELHERIVNGADFVEMAKLHSDDSSAASGGDLGWLSPGDTVPGFEAAMNALQPGEISGPVQSTFGWHLIQVVKRRTQDISTESQRHEARQSIRARKADVVIQEWQRRLRDEAYIEYRLEDG